jgi:AcrR family transcriptional regulator
MKSVRLKRERREARSAGSRSRTDRKRTATAASDTTPRRQQRLENKRIAIFDAALELFARYGLHGTTVAQIAEAADVSKTNLFYYFPTKEDVYVAALQNLLTEWLAPMLALDVEGDPIKSLSDYIRRKMEFSRKYRGLAPVLHRDRSRRAPARQGAAHLPQKARERKGRRHSSMDRRRQDRTR